MGGAPSAPVDEHFNLVFTVSLMMPLYYLDEPVSDEDIQLAKASWTTVADGTAPCFGDMIKHYKLDKEVGLVAYQECFFLRLFDVHPTAKQLFSEKAIKTGSFLIKLLDIAFNQLKQPHEYRQALVYAADDHCRRGVRAIEYGIIGEVLFWTLEKSLGPTFFDRRLETAWLRLFSSMLKIMVPIAVDFEHQRGRFPRIILEKSIKIKEETTSTNQIVSISEI